MGTLKSNPGPEDLQSLPKGTLKPDAYGRVTPKNFEKGYQPDEPFFLLEAREGFFDLFDSDGEKAAGSISASDINFLSALEA